MRILQISSASNFGGGERHLVDLCRGLSDKGHDVSVVVRPNAVWIKQLSFLPEKNIIYLPLRNSLDIFSALRLSKIIRDRKIEIVHAHPARDYPVASLAVRLSKTSQLVLTRHVFFDLNLLHKMMLPESVMFIAPTREGQQKLLQQNIIPPEQIQLIYCGINIRHFAETSKQTNRGALRRQLKLPVGKQFVGIAGEITEHKGQLDFVHAAAQVLKVLPETEFLIVGQDSSPQKLHHNKLQRLIEELNLQNKVHLLGFWEDMAPLYSILDVFVSASHVEPFGLVIAEAAASGTPVVATATAGASEIILDGKTGKLTPIKNTEALAQAIIDFLGDQEMRHEFVKKAGSRVAENFGLEEMINKTEQLYRETIKRKSQKSFF